MKIGRTTFEDENGYLRFNDNSRLVHRETAYSDYLENREKYSHPFSYYQIHHKNRDKQDNRRDNLEIVSKERHERIHGKDLELSWVIILGIIASITFTFGHILIAIILVIIMGLLLKKRDEKESSE